MSFVQLSDQINEYFNAEELADLLFRLNIADGNIGGATNAAKARELVNYCRRHGRMDELVVMCRQLRRHVFWADPEPAAAPPSNVGTSDVGTSDGGNFGTPPATGASANIPTAMPGTFQPPQVPGMFWMAYPNTWYGPFYGYFIGWMSVGGFQVWHPMMGPLMYPDPYRQMQRNMWVRLVNSPFNVYVDGGPNGYVFGQYSPF